MFTFLPCNVNSMVTAAFLSCRTMDGNVSLGAHNARFPAQLLGFLLL